MEENSQTTTAPHERVRSSERLGPTASPRPQRSIRAARCAVGDDPIFVDRGRRRLANFGAVVSCIVALGLWWAMLAVAFAGDTSGANPPLAERVDRAHPAPDGTEAVGVAPR